MSVKAMSSIALRRDDPDQSKGRATDGADAGGSLPAAVDVLVHCIPSEVLAPYTALVGIVVATTKDGGDRLLLRWAMFVVSLVLVGVTLAAGYLRSKPAGGRRLPVVEMAASMLAFGAWGLAMPGSPLSVRMSANDLTITTSFIAFGGAFLVSLLAPSLGRPATKPVTH